MRNKKFTEIISENKKLETKLKQNKIPSYKIGILSNIMIHQSKDIGEYLLRKQEILAEIKFGDYDNICQDSNNFCDQNSIIIFWELCNIIDGFQYKINDLSLSKIDDLIDKVNREMNITFENLKKVPMVIVNKFSSLIFSQHNLDSHPLKKLEVVLNKMLEDFTNIYPNLKIIDIDKIIAKDGINNSIDLRFYYSSKTLYNVQFIKNYFLTIFPLFLAPNGKTKKALILDCDNTLWKGIISEDGFSNIEIFDEIQYIIKGISKKGILLGICSKNNFEDIDHVFKFHKDMILKDEDFVIKKINWNDKVSNLIEISKELNINLDSIVFVDDSDFEINLVRQELPMVHVLQVPKKNYLYPMMLRQLVNLFYNSSQTTEDSMRLDMYKANIKRINLQKKINNLDEYLKNLSLEITCYLNDKKLIKRISQLTNKTNQFNLTTKRYSENDISFFIKEQKFIVIAIGLNDNFGENGIVGLAIIKVENEIAEIDTLLMSCRILGRKIEFKFMDIIIDFLKEKGIKCVFAEYKESSKNKQVKDLYTVFGFKKINNTEVSRKYKLYLNDYKHSKIQFIKVSFQN